MYRFGLLRTAEAEEYRRFTAAPIGSIPATRYAIVMSNLLRACLHACHKTSGKAIRFVQAGQLHLALYLTDNEFRVHDRWLDGVGAVEELGLPEDCVASDTIFHTVKTLFSEALKQLPPQVFLQDDGRQMPVERRRNLERTRTEQRLLDYFRLSNLVVERPNNCCESNFGVKWTVDPRKLLSCEVEIQCHRAACLPRIHKSIYIAEDGILNPR